MVDLWAVCRDPMGGFRHLPEGGGVQGQGAWLIDALTICAGAAAWFDKHDPQK